MSVNTICDTCKNAFDRYVSFYTDVCDKCAEEAEGKNTAELNKEDGRYDRIGGNQHVDCRP